MITQLFLAFWTSLANLVIGWLPDSPPPSLFGDSAGAVAQVFSYASQLGSWIPWPVAGAVLAAVLLSLVAGFGIKTVRMVLSLFTAGGGSAG